MWYSRWWKWALPLAALLAVVAWFVLFGNGREKTPAEPGQADSAGAGSPRRELLFDSAVSPPGKTAELDPSAARPASVPDLPQAWNDFFTAVENQQSRESVREAYAKLRDAVHASDPSDAAQFFLQFLAGGQDQPTGLGFSVGPEGLLFEAPTLRTTALDLLGQTDPRQSLEMARQILATTNSQEEYALALRNLAWANPNRARDPEIAGWFSKMLDREDWLANPGAGFLEAFDVGVEVSALEDVASVLAIQDETGDRVTGPLDRAAFMALDRIMLRDPNRVLDKLREDPSFLEWAPEHRASIFSRLDVREARQRDALKNYLLNSTHAPGELEYFAEVFPNGNFFVGPRLVTGNERVGGVEVMAEIDRSTLRLISEWKASPEFTSRLPVLETIATRLNDFLGGSAP